MPADSLLEMACRATARYSAAITDIGDLPYELVKTALLKIDNPEKLYQLELKSPQIIGHDAEVWINFLKRDIPGWQTKRHEPADPKNWYKAYKKLKKEVDQEMMKGEDALKAAFANIKNEKEQNTAQLVSRQALPKNGQPRRQMVRSGNKWTWRTGPSTKSMTLMEKIKKESRDARVAQKNTKPMHELNKTATIVRQAPPQFVEAARRKAASPPPVQTAVRAPRSARPPLHAPVPNPRGPAVEEEYDIMKDREARLQAMKSKKPIERSEPSQTKGVSSSASPPKAGEKERPGKLSSGFLEDAFDEEDEPRDHRTLLRPPAEQQRSASPGRMASPKPVLKRKAPASLFMSPSKKPMIKRPGVT